MIKVNNLTKEFISNKKYEGFMGTVKGLFSNEKEHKIAVDNVSFHIKKGEIVGYIGNNGAGKSTTIKMMTGIMVPSDGSCLVNGIEPYKNRKQNAQNIGVVFGQRTQLWWDLPLCESFSVLKELYRVSDNAYRERMEYLDDVLELTSFIKSPVRTLSLGQRMRADLAASLLHNPKVLYLDEPTIGLDVLVKEKMRKAIIEINKNYDTTVVLTTHDLEDIEQLCSRIIIIDAGRKVYDGTLDKIKKIYNPKVCLQFEVKSADEIIRRDFNEKYKLDYNDLHIFEVGGKVNFELNEKKISVSEIIIEVAKCTEIKKIDVVEKNITDIIKGIYENGIEEDVL